MTYGLSQAERARLAEEGYLVRHAVFDAPELRRIGEACESLVAELSAAAHGAKLVAGSYLFELRREIGAAVKWEPEHPELIQGVEPLAHLSPALRDLAFDPRLAEPGADMVGSDRVCLFTEKLNVKRARQGGRYALHQDGAYWRRATDLWPRIVTAMLLLDDSTARNGCLEVAPGSHRDGLQKCWGPEGPADTEMDTAAFDLARLRPVEAGGGAVVFFGSGLVHRSAPNRSAQDRRALLYSYQPAGAPHLRELTRPVMERQPRQKL